MVDSGWEEVKGTGTRLGEPLITLRKSKQIGFNSSFIRINKLENMKKVRIFLKDFDDKSVIGFVFYEEFDGGKRLIKSGGSQAAFSSVSEIFNRLKFDFSKMKTTKFKPRKEMMNKETIYSIEVPKNFSKE